jgi:hypothetical protein
LLYIYTIIKTNIMSLFIKNEIAKNQYGEFGFDSLSYEEQQEIYKNNPDLEKSTNDKYSDFS